MVQDDGSTTQYLKGAFRKTTFNWNDTTRQLSWTTEGDFSGPHSFKQVTVSVFDPAGKKTTTAPLKAKGSIHLPSA
jgi:hypothetical protein